VVDFSRNARVYDDRHGALLDSSLAERLIAAAEGDAGARILDVAAGTGRVSIALAALGHRVVATDRAAAMLGRLREKSATHADGAIAPTIADASALPFADASFAIVVVARLMYLLTAWRTAVAEIARVTRDGGHLLHEWGNGEADEPWVQVRDQARALFEAAGVANPFHPGARSEEDVDREVRAHGFTVAATIRADSGAQTTIGRFLDQIEAGELSYTWSVPEDVQRTCLPRLRQWAVERFDPTAPFAAPRALAWTVYLKG
jgi:SAM-dependent methyltransferase